MKLHVAYDANGTIVAATEVGDKAGGDLPVVQPGVAGVMMFMLSMTGAR